MVDPDLDKGQRRPARRDPKTVHDWSQPSVKTRMAGAIRLRRAERELERCMLPKDRAAFQQAKWDERARTLGEIFNWKISDAGFSVDALSPRDAAARGCGGGPQAIRDRDAGFDHLEYYREGRRPVAIVGQPYAPAFECGKREGVVAEVERERGIRIVELDPMLGWYSDAPDGLPTALVAWLRI